MSDDWFDEEEDLNELKIIDNLKNNEDQIIFDEEYKNHLIDLRENNNLNSNHYQKGIKEGYELGKIIGELEAEIE